MWDPLGLTCYWKGRGTFVREPLKLRPSAKCVIASSLHFSGFSVSQRGSFDVAV